MLQTASQLGLRSAAATPAFDFARTEDCACMGCRTNLKKEKRQRNRINAFRFKKGGFTKKRFNNGPDYAAQQKKADEDNEFFSMVRVGPRTGWDGVACSIALCTNARRQRVSGQVYTYSAEAAALAEEEAKNAPKEAAAA